MDVVDAVPRIPTGFEFVSVIEHSGHSTYMILAKQKTERFSELLSNVNATGCTYESKTLITAQGEMVLYAIDVPCETDIFEVYDVLEEGERDGIWIFQEGHVGHNLLR